MKNSKQPSVFEIQKNYFAIIKVSINTFKDKTFLGIRQYFKDIDETWRPTPKGITLSLNKIDELIQALQKVKSGLGKFENE